MKQLFGGVLILAVLVVSSAYFLPRTSEDKGPNADLKPASELSLEAEGPVQWMTFEEAVAQSKADAANPDAQPKHIFIDVYTDWCGWCKVMDKQTFSNPEIAKNLNKYFYPVKFNAEQREAIEFKGNTFKYVAQGSKGYHELAAALLQGKLSYPTVVFMDDQMRLIQAIPGFLKPAQFEPIVKFIGEGRYRDTKWDEYSKSFQSSLND